MTRDKLIETMALGVRRSVAWSSFWSEDDARELMRAAITALEAAGMVVVPRWNPMNDAPKDGRAIAVQAVIHVHHFEGARFDHMARNWRPDTPQSEWHLTGWREVEQQNEQMAASSDRTEGTTLDGKLHREFPT